MTIPRIASVLAALWVALLFSSCATKKGASSRLQGHIGQAQTASDQTANHIRDFKTSVDRVDYKASRARRLLDQGIERPL